MKSSRLYKGTIINVGATHIRVVTNIFCCNKIDIYKYVHTLERVLESLKVNDLEMSNLALYSIIQ